MSSSTSPPTTPPPATPATDVPPAAKKKNNNTATKKTFMLHAPTGEALGNFTGNNYRSAAMKAASKLCKSTEPKELHLRRTGDRKVKVFLGYSQVLDRPQEVKRGDKTVIYTKKPAVRFTKQVYEYQGDE